MRKKILILGGGISALECADLLLKKHDIWISEKSDKIGGMSLKYSCKATNICSYCGWCLSKNIIKKTKENEDKITFVLNSSLKNVKKIDGKFQTILSIDGSADNNLTENFDNIIIASGSQKFNALEKPRFGYKKYKNVITGHDLERDLRQRDFSDISTIAFIQCVGMRDESINALYCSKVCCRYALRMANYISYNYPEINITFFYMDMQVQGKDISATYKSLQKNEKIHFIRGIPSNIKEDSENKLSVRFENTKLNESNQDNFDLVVLSVGLTQNSDNEKLSRILGVNLGSNGFITTDDNYMTNIDGIFAIGTSTRPSGINDTLISSGKVVELI
jgi:heterodisulfide reductase subunit A2